MTDYEIPPRVEVKLKESIFQWVVDKLLPLLIAGLFSVGVFLFTQVKIFGVHMAQNEYERAELTKAVDKLESIDVRVRQLEVIVAQQVVINQNLEKIVARIADRQR